ncbi:MAG: SGNH/GDSL hydrolase family protein, partial [Sulfobacillus sp.]
MNKLGAMAIAVVVFIIVGVDVAGLSGAFPEPAYDAGAAQEIRANHPRSRETPAQQSPQATPHSAASVSQPSTAPSASLFTIPPAVPVPRGAIPTAPMGNGADVTTIGDSIMVDAQPYLVQLLPGIVVDGQVSRQLIAAPTVVAQLKAAGELHRYVVIELGTNGPFTAQQLTTVLQQIGPHHAFVLVNTSDPRPWEQATNHVIDHVAQTYPHTVLVNWYRAAQNIRSDFWPDQVHLKPVGAQGYATLLARAVLTLQKHYPPPNTARGRESK